MNVGCEKLFAIGTSRGSDPASSPIGCVIVRDDRTIGRAHNECQNLHDATAHAEMVAFRHAGAEIADPKTWEHPNGSGFHVATTSTAPKFQPKKRLVWR